MLELLSTIKPEVIVAGGTTLALLYFTYTSYLKDKHFFKFLNNHAQHEIEANEKLIKSFQKLIDVIEKWHEKV